MKTVHWQCTNPDCGASLKIPIAAFPFTCVCKKRHEWPQGVLGGPGLIQRAVNFSVAGVKHLATGAKLVDDVTREWRYLQCLDCEQYFDSEKETCTHKQCGCGIKKQRGIIDKLSWASQNCPIGRWGKPTMPEHLVAYLIRLVEAHQRVITKIPLAKTCSDGDAFVYEFYGEPIPYEGKSVSRVHMSGDYVSPISLLLFPDETEITLYAFDWAPVHFCQDSTEGLVVEVSES